MADILSNLKSTVISGFVLTLIMIAVIFGLTGEGIPSDYAGITFLIRWLHVLSAIMWIGLLWYFNFVQIPSMPKIPDEQKPAIGKVIAPAALWWFRWGAMATIGTGLLLAAMNKYLLWAMTLGLIGDGSAKHTAIGIGMYLGLIMWFNVWFIIWPNQKIALGMVGAEPDAKAAAARKAMLFSRTNTLLSFPMLYAMVSAQNMF